MSAEELDKLSAEHAKNTSYASVCDQILSIMNTYHEQEASPDGVETPGGLEHMGDVWRLFMAWEKILKDSVK